MILGQKQRLNPRITSVGPALAPMPMSIECPCGQHVMTAVGVEFVQHNSIGCALLAELRHLQNHERRPHHDLHAQFKRGKIVCASCGANWGANASPVSVNARDAEQALCVQGTCRTTPRSSLGWAERPSS